MYDNTIYSFFKSIVFFVNELKPPTLLLKIPYAIIDSQINLQTKQKILVGCGLLSTFSQMVSKLLTNVNDDAFQTMFNINSIIVNTFFSSLIIEGAMSKVGTLLEAPTDLNEDDLCSFRQAIVVFLLADALMLSTSIVGVFSLLNLVGVEYDSPQLSPLAENMGIIKSSCFVFGHTLMSLYNGLGNGFSDNVETALSSRIKSLWYDNSDYKFQFLTDYRNAALVSNILFLTYSIATTIQGCDGPQGPNGDKSCLNESTIERVLYFIQMICNLWVAESFLRKGIEEITTIKKFDQWSYPMTKAIVRTFNQWLQPQAIERIVPVEDSQYEEETKDANDENRVEWV